MFVSTVDTPVGKLNIHATNKAVTYVGFFDDTRFLDTHNKKMNKPLSNEISEKAAAQLTEYFQGQRKAFDLPLAPAGTDFQKQIWQQLLAVKYGETASYLDLAKAINNHKACRAVGAANAKNPISIILPCHRIVGNNGKLTGYAGGLERKSFLLSLEQTN